MHDSDGHGDVGIVVVDHGSKRDESNQLLLDVVSMFRTCSGYRVVEAAHMELAEPTIREAFDRCVEQGARTVVVLPYFLAPGKHWRDDIPALARKASSQHDDVEYFVADPLGLHPLMAKIMQQRIDDCLKSNLDNTHG